MSVTQEFCCVSISLTHSTKVTKRTVSDLCHVEGYTIMREKYVVQQLNIYMYVSAFSAKSEHKTFTS